MTEKLIKTYIELWYELIFTPSNDKIFHTLYYKSNIAWLILLIISKATFNDDIISFEGLCRIIGHKTASRSTILRLINQFLETGIIIKKTSSKDSRVKLFYLSEAGKETIETRIKNELKIFNPLAKLMISR